MQQLNIFNFLYKIIYSCLNACIGARFAALTVGDSPKIAPANTETPKANPNDHKVITVCISGKYCETKEGITRPKSTFNPPPPTLRTTVLTVLEFC